MQILQEQKSAMGALQSILFLKPLQTKPGISAFAFKRRARINFVRFYEPDSEQD
ncbi:hypothetical protein [Microbulbifer sp. SAOS-129_SWC]|uniref:hypothetical protein n=1 Tax=Microbulbifer sp. SAOS-129_SWC TaxID=3145235 RepID=UPI0032168D1D